MLHIKWSIVLLLLSGRSNEKKTRVLKLFYFPRKYELVLGDINQGFDLAVQRDSNVFLRGFLPGPALTCVRFPPDVWLGATL